MTSFDPATTAFVLIDLQQGIVGMDLSPRTGSEVVAKARDLAARFREARAPVVLVHVGWRTRDEQPSAAVDEPLPWPACGLPAEWMGFVDGLRETGDIVVLKHHWGAFTGTDLDLQLRRRGVRTIVLAGIATNFGVESTARSAWELSYDVVIVEDVTTSRTTEMHDFAVTSIFPRIARVVQSEDVTFAAE